jgi:hypothetical protein
MYFGENLFFQKAKLVAIEFLQANLRFENCSNMFFPKRNFPFLLASYIEY